MFSLVIREPFLEEGREGVAVDHLLAVVVTHDDLSVAFHGNFTESLAFAIPVGDPVQLVHGNLLIRGIARERIVDAQRLIREIPIEILRMGHRDDNQCHHEECYSHNPHSVVNK